MDSAPEGDFVGMVAEEAPEGSCPGLGGGGRGRFEAGLGEERGDAGRIPGGIGELADAAAERSRFRVTAVEDGGTEEWTFIAEAGFEEIGQALWCWVRVLRLRQWCSPSPDGLRQLVGEESGEFERGEGGVVRGEDCLVGAFDRREVERAPILGRLAVRQWCRDSARD